MTSLTSRAGRLTRIALGLIRLVNGTLALFAPDVLGGRLGVQTGTSPGLGYGLRLFGVRTILLGVGLLRADDDPHDPLVRQAVLVHGADTAAAVVVLKRGELPSRGAKLAVTASAINVVLAVLLNLLVRRARSR
ncbi:MAG TPA: hypothetical protein VJ777_08655 [Mycobacterium sp.]|nr:hypothetical protein [Mycobacterium sp.]